MFTWSFVSKIVNSACGTKKVRRTWCRLHSLEDCDDTPNSDNEVISCDVSVVQNVKDRDCREVGQWKA